MTTYRSERPKWPEQTMEYCHRVSKCPDCWCEGCDRECPPPVIPPWRLIRIIRNFWMQHQVKRVLNRSLRSLYLVQDMIDALENTR